MGFFDHLEELRRRLLISLLAVAIGAGVGLAAAPQIFHYITVPVLNTFRQLGLEDRLVFTSPGAPLKIYMEVGLLAGLVLASPVLFLQLWLFVAPGLYRHERRFVLPFLFFASGLFALGVAFAYWIALPITLKFLIGLGIQEFHALALISINEYLSLALVILLWLGVLFEIPVLIFFLSLVGLVTPGFLWRYFRHAVLLIAILAAAITPTTDVVTMTVFAVPMIGLYLVGIGVSFLVGRRRARQEAEPHTDPAR